MATPINAQTDKSGLRFYEWNGQKLMSVTSYRRVLGMSIQLHTWVLSQAINAAVSTDRGAMGDEDYKKMLWKGARAKRDAAASLGTAVHEAAENNVSAESLPRSDERRAFLLQYEEAMDELGFEVLLNEAQVFNLTLGYAGSLDIIARCSRDLPSYGLKEGDVIVVDLKTGKGIYNDHALQLGMYLDAEFVGGYDPQDDADVEYPLDTAILQSATKMGVLHLRPDEWEYVPIRHDKTLTDAVSAMTVIAQWFAANPTIETLKG